eukprot:jgi/Orpsp1_1/1187997/evm.model.d7180000061758.1
MVRISWYLIYRMVVVGSFLVFLTILSRISCTLDILLTYSYRSCLDICYGLYP